MWVSRHALKDPWQTQTALVARHKLPRVCYEGNRASLDELRMIDERHTPAAIVNLAESLLSAQLDQAVRLVQDRVFISSPAFVRPRAARSILECVSPASPAVAPYESTLQ
jgi:hypothetical protein